MRGKGNGGTGAGTERQDHPRLCGEKDNLHADVIAATGSPPPMRGKAKGFWSPEPRKRITPAYAGKSTLTFPFFTVYWDHPRLCGEKGFGKPPRGQLPGSPPPMRGKERRGQAL